MTEMIEHEGIVQSVKDGKAIVSVQTGGCSGCSHQSGCAMGRITGGQDATEMEIAVDASIQPGMRVILSLPEERMILATLLAYLLPTLAVLLGSGIAYSEWGSDGATAIGALAGLLSGVLLTRLIPDWIPVPDVRLASEGQLPVIQSH